MESSGTLGHFGVQFIENFSAHFNVVLLIPLLALLAPFLGLNCCKKDNVLKADRTHAQGQRPVTKNDGNNSGMSTSGNSKANSKVAPSALKPKKQLKTPKEKMIEDGKLKGNKNDYPTMDDVASDWESVDDAEKKAGAKPKPTT